MTHPDASSRYEITKPLDAIGPTERFEAVEKSSGTRVRLYRLAIDPGRDVDSFVNDLKRDAQWNDLRLPRLIDAWRSKEGLGYVRLEMEGISPREEEAAKWLSASGEDPVEEFAYQSLAALAGMHDFAIAHKHLDLSAFVVTRTGTVFLVDTGLWKRMNERLAGVDDATALGFSLVSNKERLDVAAWAATVASYALRKEFNTRGDDGTSAANPEQVEVITGAIRRGIPNEALADLLVHALEAFGNPEGGGFENAGEALQKFPREVLA